MKKILILLIPALALFFVINSGGRKNVLYVLNWGEYISTGVEGEDCDVDLIAKFEREYGVEIVMDEVGSSEEMYSRIQSGTTSYDIAIPGDYIIEKMYKHNMLYEIDYSKIENYSSDMFTDSLSNVRGQFFENNEKYCVPYFWGAYALIYNTREGYEWVGEAVRENGFNAIFDRNCYGEHKDDVRLAMYSVPRFCTSAILNIRGIDINTTNIEDYNGMVDVIKNADYNLWGDDIIKKQIAAGKIDVGLVQLGDFFDQSYVTSVIEGEEIQFDCYVPDQTSAFFDGMVIPKTSKNVDLALKFINFMLDTENAYNNATFVGYITPYKKVAELIDEDNGGPSLNTDALFGKNNELLKNIRLFRDIDTFSNGTKYNDYLLEIINKAKI